VPEFDDELADALRRTGPLPDEDGVFERLLSKRARRHRNRRVLLPAGVVALTGLLVAGLLVADGDNGGPLRVDTHSRRPAALDDVTSTSAELAFDSETTTTGDVAGPSRTTTVRPGILEPPAWSTTTTTPWPFHSIAGPACEPGTGSGLEFAHMTIPAQAMVDPAHAWIVSGPDVFASADGGKTWAHQARCPSTLVDLAFVDANRGWALAGRGGMAETTDGGRTWRMHSLPQRDWQVLAFADAGHGWISDYERVMARTDDGGRTWRNLYATGNLEAPSRLLFTDALHGWSAGYSGPPRVTVDGGVTWSTLTTPEYGGAYGVASTDVLTAWIAGGHGIDRTDDGGRTFTAGVMPFLDGYFFDVTFVDEQHGWAAGRDGTDTERSGAIVVTTDGGATWTRQNPGITANLFARVEFVDLDHGLATSYNGVMRTSDGGKTWE
jgi:photosystem II stability/assembly factor-like uncharacterized protein